MYQTGVNMSIPHINDTRESYVERMKATYLDIAERQYEAVGDTITMWQHLFNWVQCEEIYGGHWDDLNARGKI
jgi:hypothetical protein